MNFFELQRNVLATIGRTPVSGRSDTADTDTLQLTKDAVNNVIQEIAAQEKFWFMKRSDDLLTVALVDTGTVAVTNGSTGVVGTGTAFALLMVGRKFRVASDEIVYKVETFTDGTNITLNREYQGETATGSSFEIYQNVYNLRTNFDELISIKERSKNQFLVELTETEFDALSPDPESSGTPTRFMILGKRRATYSTGDVALVVNTATVTGTSTVWTKDEHLGSIFQVSGDNISYIVESVDSNTQITLNRNYEGDTTTSNKNYTLIGDFATIFVDPIPDAVVSIEYRYHSIPLILGDNQDIPDIPSKYDWTSIHGARSEILTYRKELDRAQLFRAYYLAGINTIIEQNRVSSSRIDQLRGRREAFRRIPSRITLPVIG